MSRGPSLDVIRGSAVEAARQIILFLLLFLCFFHNSFSNTANIIGLIFSFLPTVADMRNFGLVRFVFLLFVCVFTFFSRSDLHAFFDTFVAVASRIAHEPRCSDHHQKARYVGFVDALVLNINNSCCYFPRPDVPLSGSETRKLALIPFLRPLVKTALVRMTKGFVMEVDELLVPLEIDGLTGFLCMFSDVVFLTTRDYAGRPAVSAVMHSSMVLPMCRVVDKHLCSSSDENEEKARDALTAVALTGFRGGEMWKIVVEPLSCSAAQLIQDLP